MTAQHSTQPTQTERRSGLADRRGNVDAILFGAVASAQSEAERAYRVALMSCAPDRAYLEGVAEGLAQAMQVLSGTPADEWRAQAFGAAEREAADGLAGVAMCRRIIERMRTSV